MQEPLRVLLYVRVVRRTLEGDVYGKFEPQVSRGVPQFFEIRESSQLRMNGLVTTFAGTDGPGTAGVRRADFQTIIFSLSSSAPDGMNGRKVQNIETHLSDIGNACDAITKR